MRFVGNIRPILEYGSIIWDPFTSNSSMQLERIQCTFLEHTSFILNVQCLSHDYAPIFRVLSLDSLADCRWTIGKIFLSDMLLNTIDCPALFSLINFKICQYRIRIPKSLYIPKFRFNYIKNESMRCLMSLVKDPSFLI